MLSLAVVYGLLNSISIVAGSRSRSILQYFSIMIGGSETSVSAISKNTKTTHSQIQEISISQLGDNFNYGYIKRSEPIYPEQGIKIIYTQHAEIHSDRIYAAVSERNPILICFMFIANLKLELIKKITYREDDSPAK